MRPNFSALIARFRDPTFILLVMFGAGLLLAGFGDRLTVLQEFVLCAVLLTLFAVAHRRGAIHFFGPLPFYDLVRLARRGRYVSLRCLYSCILLGTLCAVYMSWFGNPGMGIMTSIVGGTIDARVLPVFAESCFTVFMTVQFAVVYLLMPAYTAAAISEEKERKTLEFVLSTDLLDREIVIGKLTARLANMALLLLTGLPILSLIGFLGGVDPLLVLAGFAATGLTMLLVGSLSILTSVYATRSLDAIFFAYFWLAFWLIVSAFIPGVRDGNLLVVLVDLSKTRIVGGNIANVLGVMLQDYAFWNGLESLLLVVWAIWRVRKLGLRVRRGVRKRSRAERIDDLMADRWKMPRRKRRPYMGDRALLWKELYTESKFTLLVRIHPFLATLIALSLLLVACLYVIITVSQSTGHHSLAAEANLWVRGVGTPLACAMLLGVAVAAAGTVTLEHERQTLESLLTTPYDDSEFLAAKWLGSIFGPRAGWWLLGAMWIFALSVQGLHPAGLLLSLLAWFAYAAFLASLGIWFSTRCPTTMQAILRTLSTIFLICVMGCLLRMWGGPLLYAWLPGEIAQGLVRLQWYGLTPPMPLLVMPFSHDSVNEVGHLSSWENILAAMVGLACYVLAAWILWRSALSRFAAYKGPPPLAAQVVDLVGR